MKMSIQVENNLKNLDNEKSFEQRVHYMPCKIEEDGKANVEKYFEQYIMDNGNGELTGTYRGHPLDGVTLPLPDGYRALLLTEAKRPLNEHADRKLQVSGGFRELVYWNWDKKPSNNDTLVKAFQWTQLAEVIHGD